MHSTDNGSESGGEQTATASTTNGRTVSTPGVVLPSLPANTGAVNNNSINSNHVTISSSPSSSSSATTIPSGLVAVASAGPVTVATTRECAGCRKRITERFLLKALDLFWHEDCLKCGCCDCRLGEVGSTLYTKANLILCKRDYLRLFGTTGYCAACNKVIPAFEMVMRAKSNVYHLECFACQQCNHRFCVGDRFYLCDNKILCEYDYEERLVFANMAYNPSSLAHIRRQVSNLQPSSAMMTQGRTAASTAILDRYDDDDDVTNTFNSSSPRPHPPLLILEEMMMLTSSSPSCYSGKNSSSSLQAGLQPRHTSNNNNNNNNSVAMATAPSGGLVCSSSGSNNTNSKDDGSSGYGSPDSETFEPTTLAQQQQQQQQPNNMV